MVQPLWKIVWQFLPKLNIYLPYNLAMLPLNIYPERNENVYPFKSTYMNVYGSSIYNHENLQTT